MKIVPLPLNLNCEKLTVVLLLLNLKVRNVVLLFLNLKVRNRVRPIRLNNTISDKTQPLQEETFQRGSQTGEV